MIQYRVFQLLLVLVRILHHIDANPACDSLRYGSPSPGECIRALRKFPEDRIAHFFVEQQMRSSPPLSNWAAFQDPRPKGQKENIEQLPKWIAYG